MLRPILLVGVGGSGGKTLRAMRQSLLRKLRAVGWDKPGLPEGWQMVWVDSVSIQNQDGFRAPLLPPVDYAGLVSSGLSYANLRATLEQSVPGAQRQSTMAGWVPQSVPIAIAAGAGQARAIGRVISAAQLKKLKSTLQNANDRMSGVAVSAELAELSAKFGQSAGVPQTEPMAIVVSSIAGGSGSGMFLDVAEALKSVNLEFRQPGSMMTVLYTPDVFESIAGAGTQIPPNSLAAIMETTTGVLAEGLSASTAGLFQSSGLVGRSRHGFGAKCNFLVGAGNQNVNLGSQEDVYYAVGESLCAVVTDDIVQENLRGFALTNIFLQSGEALLVQDESRLTDAADKDQSMPFAALGMGRVNLGTDRLADYISGLVGRDITEQLLWPDFEPVDPQRQLTKEQLIDMRVAGVWDDFLRDSGVNERDPANEVVESLSDAGQAQRLASWAAEGHARAQQGVDDGGLPPGEWTIRLQQFFTNFLPTIRAQETANRYEHAVKWTTAVQAQLTELVAQTSVRYGLSVTINLIQRLLDEMTFVVEELNVQAQTKRGQVGLVTGKLTQVLSVGGSKLPANDNAVNQAVQVVRIGAELVIDADRHELAATLLKDLSENQIQPLLRAVQFSRAQLSESVNSDKLEDGRPNNWALQPDYDRPVPSQLLPGATERVLIQPDQYVNVLAEQIGLCLADATEKQAWRSVIRERSALGKKLSTGEGIGQGLITIASSWVPTDTKASATSLAAATAAYAMPSTFIQVTELVAKWLGNVELSAGLGGFLKQGLVEYVHEGTPEHQVQRQTDLVSAFTEAVAIASPFVKVNKAVKTALHPNVDDSNKAVISTIPFPPGDPLYERLKSVLVNGGLWHVSQSPKWFGTAKVDGIEVFTMSGSAMMPMVFDNLMTPISESWAKNNGNESLKHSFWSNRRARPLIETIPAGAGQVAAMLRGWFLAGLFNQRPIDQDTVLGWEVQIWDPETRINESFPYPLLSSAPVNKAEIPAVVLKSLAIAMVKVNETGTLAPLRPYWRLLDLGRAYNTVLEAWIRDGKAPTSESTPDSAIAGSASDSLESRRDKVLETLQKTRASYETEFSKIEALDDAFSTSRSWELREEIIGALMDLSNASSGISDDTGVL